jgi:predicted ATPase
LEELDRAERARIVQPIPGVPGKYRFAHALLRETLYGELLSGRKQRLHFRAAEALESASRYDINESLPALVRHFVQGAALGGSDRAVAYSVQLGQRSLRQYAYEAAADVFAQA